jgi:hypothetical protein
MQNKMRMAGLALLTASLGGNVVLGRTQRGRVEDRAPGAAPDAPTAADLPSGRPGPDGRACGVESLEAQVAQKSAALRAAMPAELLFASGEANPEAERLMAPILTEALSALGSAARDPRLRCRDVACEVVFRESAAVAPGAWESALARHAGFRSWTSEYGLSDARPVPADDGQMPLVERTVHFKLRPAPVATNEPGAEMRLHAAEAVQRVLAATKPSFIERATTKPGERHAPPRP